MGNVIQITEKPPAEHPHRPSSNLPLLCGSGSLGLGDVALSRGNPIGGADCYLARVKMAQDYYPGGMSMPGRSYQPGEYRYGHNGQESDPELTGNWGSHYTAEFWMYDSRLVRRWELDPVKFAYISPYAAFENNPVFYSDVKGDCVKCEEEANELNTATNEGTVADGTTYTDEGGRVFTYSSNVGNWLRTDTEGATTNGQSTDSEGGQPTDAGSGGQTSIDPSRSGNNKTGYTYSPMDWATRRKVLANGGINARGLLASERDGLFRPIYDPNSPYGKKFQAAWDSPVMSDYTRDLSNILATPIAGTLLTTTVLPVMLGAGVESAMAFNGSAFINVATDYSLKKIAYVYVRGRMMFLTGGGSFLLMLAANPVAPRIISSVSQHSVFRAIERGFTSGAILRIVREGTPVLVNSRHGLQWRYMLNGNTVIINATTHRLITVFSNNPGSALFPPGQLNPFK